MEVPPYSSRPHSHGRAALINRILRGKKISYIEKIVEIPSPRPSDKVNTTVVVQCLPVNMDSVNSQARCARIVTASREPSTQRQGMRSPRSLHRPASINVQQSNGFTAIATSELKQKIHDSRNDEQTTITQVPIDRREPLPPTPTTPFYLAIMGNKPSSTAGSQADDRPSHGLPRSSKAVSRKSSYNVFKRVDSRSPLPRDVTSSAMSVEHHNSHQSALRAGRDDDGDDYANVSMTAIARSNFQRPQSTSRRFSRVSHTHSTSANTITEDRARQPLSASATIRDLRLTDHGRGDIDNSANEGNDKRSRPSLHTAALSPTLPAPSPLPEDSPHKYGLRDKMDTPELPAEAIVITKARRKSSGLEIFNEAKSLESASSFLNGLSTSRRRAESAADTSTSSWTALNAPSRPSSTRPSSRQPSSGYQEGEGRRNGHNFKSSGFAYSRPLNLTQLKCFRGHARLLVSRNKHAQVECAVCHIDDEGDHFSCSWCAIRMCKYCRRDFAQRGMTALRERIKTAELGSTSENSSSSSLVRRGRTLSSGSVSQIAG